MPPWSSLAPSVCFPLHNWWQRRWRRLAAEVVLKEVPIRLVVSVQQASFNIYDARFANVDEARGTCSGLRMVELARSLCLGGAGRGWELARARPARRAVQRAEGKASSPLHDSPVGFSRIGAAPGPL